MKIWELHRDLSYAIGDGVDTDSTHLPDGSRFTADQRNSYLYRAALKVYYDSLKSLLQLPRKQQVNLLHKIFPSRICVYETTHYDSTAYLDTATYPLIKRYDDLEIEPLYILSITGLVNTLNTPYFVPIPIKDEFEFNSITNGRIVLNSDPIALLVLSQGVQNVIDERDSPDEQEPHCIVIWDKDFQLLDQIRITYIDKPIDLSIYEIGDQSNNAIPNIFDTKWNIEEYMIPTILNQAHLFALIDDQIENITQQNQQQES